jgi:N-acetylglucosamine kinase-like BadF-type ATPase
MTEQPMEPDFPLALGIDAGGSETRWALARGPEQMVHEGHLRGFSALELHGPGRSQVVALLQELAGEVLACGRPLQVHAGITGLGIGDAPVLAGLIAEPLGLELAAVRIGTDIDTAYLDLFAPGEGYMVYAGTGSVAAFIDADGTLHRAGGHGALLDDGGGGYWVAKEALRQVWRREDEQPGCWRESPMARELFALIGGPTWAETRQFVYTRKRGDIGRLALAVARAADRDLVAASILRAAGTELARLARAMLRRFGPRPVVLSGRASLLDHRIAEAMAEALPAGTPFSLKACHGQHAAARLALRNLPPKKEAP